MMTTLTQKLGCRNLYEYLSNLPAAILDTLYENPAACMAVFREMPELAKHHIMRMLFEEQPTAAQAVSSWVANNTLSDHLDIVNMLIDMRIWLHVPLKGGMQAYNLSETFRVGLKKSMITGCHIASNSSSLEPDKHAKAPESLEDYASERWEVLLHYLVGSRHAAVSNDIKDLTVQCDLMRMVNEDGKDSAYITAKGFQFLLLDTHSQVWFFVLEYLEWIKKRGLNLVPIIKFLFEMSFASLGMDLPMDGSDEHVIQCLQHLRETGLIFQRKRTSRRFYPTRLSINLMNRRSLNSVSLKSKGFIIAETNYRIYAYTESDLQYAILSLFCDMIYRFPNVCVGQLTRESIQMAVSHGIGAEQILHYLRSNAHPGMTKSDPVPAPTLADQIRLWEMERDRLIFQEGVLYNQFLSQKDFEILRDYAEQLKALVWQNETSRYMVVNKLAHDQVKKFWKKFKKSGVSNG